MLKVSEGDARTLLQAVGFNQKIVKEWTVERLQDKLRTLPDAAGEENKPKDKKLAKLFADVMTLADDGDGDEIVVVAEKSAKAGTPAVKVEGGKGKAGKKPAPVEEEEEEDEMDEEEEIEDEEIEDEEPEEEEDEEDAEEESEEDGEQDGEDEEAEEEEPEVDEEEDDEDAPVIAVGDKVSFTYKGKKFTGKVKKIQTHKGGKKLYSVDVGGHVHTVDDADIEPATTDTFVKKPTPKLAPGKKGKPVAEEDTFDLEEDEVEEDEVEEEEEEAEEETSDDEEESDESEEEADDEDDTTDSDLESEEEEDDMDEAPAKKTPAKKPTPSQAAGKKNGKPEAKKPAPFKSEGGDGKPGVIDSIVEFLSTATEQKPISKPTIVQMVKKRFPKKEVEKIESTVGQNVPTKLRTNRGLDIRKNEKGYYLAPSKKKAKK